MKTSYVLLYFLLLLVSGCKSYNDVKKIPSVSGDIHDNNEWYDEQATNDILDVKIDIPNPNDFLCSPYDDPYGELHPCTLEDIDKDEDATDDYKPQLHVSLAIDNYNTSDTVNAVMKQKGKSTRHSPLKSYRLKLDNDTLFYKERTYQFNKHPNDKSRVRQKLSFDFFQEIPNITSSKTKFARLEINDENYGLFTHVEKTDEYFLKHRGWDKDDHIYKAQNFAFRYTDALSIDKSGKPIDKKAFEAVIEPSTGEKDYTKLITMLKELEQVQNDNQFMLFFNKYFNRKNYLTWMAINLIFANKDTVSQNFFLYNPLHSDTFYFLPWDYDGIGRDTYKYAKWELGIGTWWGIPLHNKFLKIKKNREDLDRMVDSIRTHYVTQEKIKQKLDSYREIVEPFIHASPDNKLLPYEIWEKEFNKQYNQIEINIKNYKSQIGAPMPFWQLAKYEDGVLKLFWEQSIDLEGDKIVYDLLFADNPDFVDPLIAEKKLSKRSEHVNITQWGQMTYTIDLDLKSGKQYYMKVTAIEDKNASSYQIAFDKEVIIDKKNYFGVLELTVE